ncbi:MAG: hypothetical protein RLN90_01535 [Balneolaceae bacterium]
MNKYPLIEMLAFFSRHIRMDVPVWRLEYVRQVVRVRSSHSKVEGGIKKSFYSVETKEGEIFNLEFNQEDLLWCLEQSGHSKGFTIDRVLVHCKRHKHSASDSHRIVPIRFEVFPVELIERKTPIELALIDRIKPYRFKRGKHGSIQVKSIETQHNEPKLTEKNLNYVVEDTDGRFYHVLFVPDLLDWRFMQEVDEQFFFVRKLK